MENNMQSPANGGSISDPVPDEERCVREFDVELGHKVLQMKILDAHLDILKCDWSPDMAYQVQGNIVRYVSLSKMKANIAPIFQSHGLLLNLSFDKPEILAPAGKLAQHYMIRMEVTLTDAGSGFSTKDVVWGEAGDTGDKGITKAESYAFKQWLSTKFMLADGIDIEDEQMQDQPRFTKRSEAETEEMKSKVLSNAVKPETPVPAKEVSEEVPVKQSAEKASVKTERSNGVQKAPKVAPEDKSVEPEKPKDIPNAEGYKLEGPQAKAINKIIADWEKRAKEGRISPEEYNAMSADVVSIASPADAVAFIKKYRAA